ncbi:uncharacterized protein LOC126602656 [Malus sylvestris]|uniref:uncharacterized protein LOC126602656 n=1 Tax=Malus sylvestris TaxID=3752 RepID=UPI0021AD466F|nr:uncharacterized protein LOC126602656 [Malus sylvestris]
MNYAGLIPLRILSQQEIVSLYQRFCQLDRSGGGFISSDEFLSVPEFAVNPLSQRLLKILDGLNFKEFVLFLSAFSSRASLQQKIEFIFKVYDSDGNGKVAFSDMLDVLRDLTGQFISEQQREQVLTHVIEESGYTKDSLLSISDFVKIISLLRFETAIESSGKLESPGEKVKRHRFWFDLFEYVRMNASASASASAAVL